MNHLDRYSAALHHLHDLQGRYRSLARIEGELTRDERAEKARLDRAIARQGAKVDRLKAKAQPELDALKDLADV